MDIEKITESGWSRITDMMATRGMCDEGETDEARAELDYGDPDFTRETMDDFESARPGCVSAVPSSAVTAGSSMKARRR